MIRCMIVDDEEVAIDILKSYVEKTPSLQLVATTLNPLEVLTKIEQEEIDLLFLDIHMPHISGIELLKLINGRCQVILTTAYTQYALDGFEHKALDYLVKPISFERFLKAVQRVNSPAGILNTIPAPTLQDEFFFVKTEIKGRILKVQFKDIIYVEGLKNYLSIYTINERIICYLSFKQLAEILPSSFARVHKSYIVSIDKIKAIDGNLILFYDCDTEVPLGETYRSFFLGKLQEKMAGGKKG